MATTESSASAHPSTRRHRVDERFLELLEEDFGIEFYSLNKAFMGVPACPKKQAIALCEWAIRSAKGDVGEAGKALRGWAQRRGAGLYDRCLVDAPEITYETNDHLRSMRRLYPDSPGPVGPRLLM